jgi:DNA-binding NtrC family response regulator
MDAEQRPQRQDPSPSARPFDDRESFRVAEAALSVICRLCERFPNEQAAWEAFIDWRGRDEREYLRRIRAGRRFIFYSVLQDLYDFIRHLCAEGVTAQVGERLAEVLLERHMPDILQSSLVPRGVLAEQTLWLVRQFTAGTTAEVYELDAVARPSEPLCITVRYRSEADMVDYLKRTGHNPERAFANSFEVFKGALGVLLARAIYGFCPEQLQSELHELHGKFVIALTHENRFHYENMIEMLMSYVRQLSERRPVETQPALDAAPVHVSEAIRDPLERVRRAAACDETVLIRGESGTGKSYYARVIHETGARRDGPFVEVGVTSDVGSDNLIQSNLFGHVRGAFTGAEEEKRGLFALADGGTVFLDEIGDASAELQAKLLRVLESKSFKMLGGLHDVSVDARIVAATNKDLAAMVDRGGFREDLFYRLNVINIALPPLRERGADIPGLVQTLFAKVCLEAGKPGRRLSEEAVRAICAYRWPGNVRELENALRHAVAFAQQDDVGLLDLPPQVGGDANRAAAERVVDREALARALAAGRRPPAVRSFEWPAHVDYARREYLRALIHHHRGSLKEVAEHWDRSSENTLRKMVREFALEDDLRAAREGRR